MNFTYSDANFSKQICTCTEVQVRGECQVIQEGKSDTFVIWGTGVEGSHFTTVTTTCARPQNSSKVWKPFSRLEMQERVRWRHGQSNWPGWVAMASLHVTELSTRHASVTSRRHSHPSAVVPARLAEEVLHIPQHTHWGACWKLGRFELFSAFQVKQWR